MLFDSHSHLNDDQFAEDLQEVVARAREAGVRRVVVPGVDAASSRRAVLLAEQIDEVYAAVGIHPEAALNVPARDFEEVERLAAHPKVVAIGEIGLDYYWDAAPRPQQREVAARQMAIAARCGLPVVIHTRDAMADTLALLQSECRGRVRGVMHCFTGTLEDAKTAMNLGFFISFGGPVTFKNAPDVREVAARIPDEWLLAETDAPYLSPAPFRGKRNEPARVRLVVEKLAEVRGQTVAAVEHATYENGHRLFQKVQKGEAGD
ncbi:TatD family hydrolase [Alicyclobacillus cycloheptanicus]|uniref:TatD DNase family protein n=1 Tax=Alicyclobacillus cycloheptanicus TaxID=1457 RepID=A0ABT9XIP7_9BACL|nr:TatD family hydrolase [Alicyclobacillus cycloheptanicus]MDQ0190176.1 TatD DNase family protein [Alicyclobacillus cycloheptanicus]WDM02571.1 TatD family hydrolase [Alicyclobacillus cycloheptanicus]